MGCGNRSLKYQDQVQKPALCPVSKIRKSLHVRGSVTGTSLRHHIDPSLAIDVDRNRELGIWLLTSDYITFADHIFRFTAIGLERKWPANLHAQVAQGNIGMACDANIDDTTAYRSHTIDVHGITMILQKVKEQQ